MQKIRKLSLILSSVFLFTLNPSYAEYKLEKIETKESIGFLEKLFKKFNFCSSVSEKYDEWRKKQVLVCKGKGISEVEGDDYCEREPRQYVKVNLLGGDDGLLIDIYSDCIPHAESFGFSLFVENNNCYILPRMGESVEFLGKVTNTNDKKEALLVHGRVMFQGQLSDYIQKCFIRENKFVCKNIIYAEDYEGMALERSHISVSLGRINLGDNYLAVKGEIIKASKKASRKYPFEARFILNQNTGDLILKELLINKQFISVLSKEELPANDYLRKNPEIKAYLDEIIKKHKILVRESVVNKIDIIYEGKQYTVISFLYKDGGTYATIAIPNDAKNPKLYKIHSGEANIFSGDKNLPEAVRASLLFFSNVSLEGRELYGDMIRIKCKRGV